MVTRMRAVKVVLGMGLTIVEFVIAIKFFISLVGTEIFHYLEDIKFNWSGPRSFIGANRLEGPVNFLCIVLAFMLISSVIIILGPKLVEREEKRMRYDYE